MTAFLEWWLQIDIAMFAQGWTIEILMLFYRVWHVAPFAFVIFYAGLQTVNHDTLESAIIDGASRWQRLRYVVIPWSGVPRRDRETLAGYPHVTVINSHFNAGVAAEHAWALLLGAAKRLLPVDRALRQGDWSPRYRDGNLGDVVLGYRPVHHRLVGIPRNEPGLAPQDAARQFAARRLACPTTSKPFPYRAHCLGTKRRFCSGLRSPAVLDGHHHWKVSSL